MFQQSIMIDKKFDLMNAQKLIIPCHLKLSFKFVSLSCFNTIASCLFILPLAM